MIPPGPANLVAHPKLPIGSNRNSRDTIPIPENWFMSRNSDSRPIGNFVAQILSNQGVGRELRHTKAPLRVVRRERDSNPRSGNPESGFQDRRLKPLGHPSAYRLILTCSSLWRKPIQRGKCHNRSALHDEIQSARRLLGIPCRVIYPTFMTQAPTPPPRTRDRRAMTYGCSDNTKVSAI